MTEKIFNLFLFIENGIVHKLGAVCHRMSGSDQEKTDFLRSQAETDLAGAKLHPVPERYILLTDDTSELGKIRYQSYAEEAAQLFGPYDIFEEILVEFRAPRNLLACISPVEDGKICFDESVPLMNLLSPIAPKKFKQRKVVKR